MQANDLLNAAKDRLKLVSDYQMAKRLNLPRQSMPGIREGTRPLPLDVAYKLAIILELDPAQVVAELEAERERNPQRAAFWKVFPRNEKAAWFSGFVVFRGGVRSKAGDWRSTPARLW